MFFEINTQKVTFQKIVKQPEKHSFQTVFRCLVKNVGVSSRNSIWTQNLDINNTNLVNFFLGFFKAFTWTWFLAYFSSIN